MFYAILASLILNLFVQVNQVLTRNWPNHFIHGVIVMNDVTVMMSYLYHCGRFSFNGTSWPSPNLEVQPLTLPPPSNCIHFQTSSVLLASAKT